MNPTIDDETPRDPFPSEESVSLLENSVVPSKEHKKSLFQFADGERTQLHSTTHRQWYHPTVSRGFSTYTQTELNKLPLTHRLEVASLWLEDAMHLRTALPLYTEHQVNCYKVLHGSLFWVLRKTCSLLFFLLPFWEFPHSVSRYPWTAAVSLVAYLFLCTTVYLDLIVQRRAFWCNKWKVVKGLCIVLSIVDVLCSICMPSVFFWQIRPLRMLRMFFVIEDSIPLRSNALFLVSLCPMLLSILAVMCIYLSSFALIGFVVFQPHLLPERSLDGFIDFVIVLFITLTTVNFPDVSLPSYTDSSWFAVFFVSFLIIGLFYMSNLIIAEVFFAYKIFMKSDYEAQKCVKTHSANAAFDIVTPADAQTIEYETFDALLSVLYPLMRSDTKKRFFRQIDFDEKGFVQRKHFHHIVHLLRFQLSTTEKHQRAFALKSFLTGILGPPEDQSFRRKMRRVYTNRLFRVFVNAVIVLSAVLVYVEVKSDVWDNNVTWTGWVLVNTGFLLLFVLECGMGIVSWGAYEFWRNSTEMLKFYLVFAFFLSSILPPYDSTRFLVFRSLLLFRLTALVPKVREIVQTTLRMVPVFSINFVSVACVMYWYAIVGMWAFHGLLVKSNSDLIGTAYAAENFYPVNFNSFSESLFTLFHLLVVNNWHITMSGAVAVTSKWCRLYFISFWFIVVTVMFAVILAFFVDMFGLQREFSVSSGDHLGSLKLSEMMEQNALEWKVMGKWRASKNKL